MGSNRTNKEIAIYTAEVIQALEDYLHTLVKAGNPDEQRADKIDQWLDKWTQYLQREQNFNPRSIPPLQRGSVIHANLGFNVGREYGGFHYAIVLNKIDSKRNHLLHILPLTSVKENTDLDKLKYFQFSLGNEIHNLLVSKANKTIDELEKNSHNLSSRIDQSENERKQLEQQIQKLSELPLSPDKIEDTEQFFNQKITELNSKIEANSNELNKIFEDIEFATVLIKKIGKMKVGSIALLNQITTISKIRLVDPIKPQSFLTGITLSAKQMQEIDKALEKIL